MKKIILMLSIVFLCVSSPAYSDDKTLEEYISGFDYQARRDMKIDSKSFIPLLKEGRAQLIDIRFAEEFTAWRMGFAKNIPLNELPKRLKELDKNKIIVTACPHKDRAIIAMCYLQTKGFKVKYLRDGLLGLAEYLRGDKAKNFIK
ncbi:Rhodanese domain-containing protein [Candidatus Magnetomoraceae bacterium gMMP-1]